jgi:hypothetical protein
MVFSAAMLRVVDADKNAANAETTSKNAITLSELFQSYPALYDFLLAVLKACVSGELTVDGGGSLPPMLPILVLLYRVQPLESCDLIVAERMQSFNGALHACLYFHHLRVRQAAAKALCNLSGGETGNPLSVANLYQGCISILQSPKDWNELHGAILLLKEMSLEQKLNQDMFDVFSDFDALSDLLRVSDRGLAAPPLCIIDAIHVLDLLEESGVVQHLYCDLCSLLISWVSEDTKNRMEVPGMYELCTIAAQTTVRLWTRRIFEIPRQTDEMTKAVENLSNLFHSNVFEVRVASVKTFKKLIYRGLDSLVALLHVQDSYSSILKILQVLADALVDAIQKELSRDTLVATSTVGTHTPTLRRLTRCLLEVMTTQRSFVSKQHGFLALKLSTWHLGMAILDRERGDAEEPTPLVGNAIELLAVDFCKEDSHNFWPVLQRLASSSVPWRLRYSAACAVSCLWQYHVDLRFQLHPLVSQLLQDEDPDCRYEMVKAVRPDTSSTLCVPEYVLTTFVRNNQDASMTKNVCIFIESLADLAHQTMTTLSRLVKEREADSQRKIFEEEDPNSYHEPALLYQTLLVVYWDALQPDTTTTTKTTEESTASSTWVETHNRLATSVIDILTLLMNRPDDADHLSTIVFSTLHTVVLAAVTLSLVDLDTKKRVIQAVQSLWSLSMDRPHSLLWHPVWTSLIQGLATHYAAIETTPLSWEYVQQFCFLLPSSSSIGEDEE